MQLECRLSKSCIAILVDSLGIYTFLHIGTSSLLDLCSGCGNRTTQLKQQASLNRLRDHLHEVKI